MRALGCSMETWPPTHPHKQHSRKRPDLGCRSDPPSGPLWPQQVASPHWALVSSPVKWQSWDRWLRASLALTFILCVSEVRVDSDSRAPGNLADSQSGSEPESSGWASATSDFLSGWNLDSRSGHILNAALGSQGKALKCLWVCCHLSFCLWGFPSWAA